MLLKGAVAVEVLVDVLVAKSTNSASSVGEVVVVVLVDISMVPVNPTTSNGECWHLFVPQFDSVM